MNASELCASIAQGLPPLFECSPAPQGAVRIRTPMMYPDGTVIDLFVLPEGSGYLLTDYGDTLGWLRMQSPNPKRSRRQQLLVEDTCQSLGLELLGGQLRLHSGSDELAEAAVRIAQGMVRVSDVWFTHRSRALQTTADEVDEWLRERTITFDRAVKEMGRSNREWTIDFRTTTADRTALVFLLSAGSRSAAPSVTNRVVAGCVDLSHLKESHGSLALVSLFDDTEDIWRSDDFALLENVSEIARWSRPDEFESLLRAT